MNLFNPYHNKMYKLRSWIDESQLTAELSLNVNAIEYLEGHPEKIDYSNISFNNNAIHIIEKNLDKCNKYGVNVNPNMINVLRNNRSLLNCALMCYYEHGIEFVEELIKNNELDKTCWDQLSRNGAAIHILEQYPEKIDWFVIIRNKNSEHIIRNNLDKVEGFWATICEQPHLIKLIEEHPEKIVWYNLSMNKNAEHLLKNNLDNININVLCYNENGFELLLQLGHTFSNNIYYDKRIVYEYWNYCIIHNIVFALTKQLCICGYTDEHFEFIQNHPIDYFYLSHNSHIFIYDYSKMKKTREQQPWYRHIKNEFI